MNEEFQLQAFIERDGKLEPFLLRISPPVLSEGEDYRCEVHAPGLLKKDTEIFGIDADQAQQLAVQFVKSLLGDTQLVDQDRRPVAW